MKEPKVAPPSYPDSQDQPLAEEVVIIRMTSARLRNSFNPEEEHNLLEGDVPPSVFDFSSTEREEKVEAKRKISLFAHQLTCMQEAWNLLGCNPKKNAVILLLVAKVRGIKPSNNPNHVGLDAKWDQAKLKTGEPDERPGAIGHCAIWNLGVGSKSEKLSLKQALVEARSSIYLMTDSDMKPLQN